MENARHKLIIILLVTLFITVLLFPSFTSCSRQTYITFESNNNPQFSFEYPSSYIVIKQIYDSAKLATIVALEIHKNVSGAKFLEYPIVTISGSTTEFGSNDIGILMDKYLSNFTGMNNISNFKVLERDTINVSGYNAEYAKYSYRGDSGDGMGKYLVFDSSGITWILNAVYSIEESSELDPFFDQLIRTFKISGSTP